MGKSQQKYNRKKLKNINPKLMLSASDRKETLDKSESFLKGGSISAFWNKVVNFMKA